MSDFDQTLPETKVAASTMKKTVYVKKPADNVNAIQNSNSSVVIESTEHFNSAILAEAIKQHQSGLTTEVEFCNFIVMQYLAVDEEKMSAFNDHRKVCNELSSRVGSWIKTPDTIDDIHCMVKSKDSSNYHYIPWFSSTLGLN